MGVMSCSRKGCGNILCHISIYNNNSSSNYSRYICVDCKNELDAWKDKWENVPVYEVSEKVQWFMDETSPGETQRNGSTEPDDVLKEFNSLFSYD